MGKFPHKIIMMKVSIQVMNPEGLGPASTVVVMTEEGGE